MSFTKAKKVNLVREEDLLSVGIDIESINRVEKFRMIAKDNQQGEKSHEYAMVSPAYKIVQHEEVNIALEKALDELDIPCNSSYMENNIGGQGLWRIQFEVPITIGVKQYNPVISVRNSYDTSSALRLEVAIRGNAKDINLSAVSKEARYSHKHTKGVSSDSMKKNLEKGLLLLNEKLVGMLNNLLGKEVDTSIVVAHIDLAMTKKLCQKDDLEKIRDCFATIFGKMSLFDMIEKINGLDIREENKVKVGSTLITELDK